MRYIVWLEHCLPCWGVVSLLWCGGGSSPKNYQQFTMNPQEHNRSWKGSAMCLLLGVGVVWCGVVWCGVVVWWCVWCGVVWCGVLWCVVVCCVVLWIVLCCVVGRRRCVVGYVNFIVNASAVWLFAKNYQQWLYHVVWYGAWCLVVQVVVVWCHTTV